MIAFADVEIRTKMAQLKRKISAHLEPIASNNDTPPHSPATSEHPIGHKASVFMYSLPENHLIIIYVPPQAPSKT
jgi:hypothetical protein